MTTSSSGRRDAPDLPRGTNSVERLVYWATSSTARCARALAVLLVTGAVLAAVLHQLRGASPLALAAAVPLAAALAAARRPPVRRPPRGRRPSRVARDDHREIHPCGSPHG